MEILTRFQIEVLQSLADDSLFSDFYLTGGTALSAYYLQHRYSEDLDLFTEVPQGVARVGDQIQKIATKNGWQIVWGKRFQTLLECSLVNTQGEKLEMDFALDMPGRLQPTLPGKAEGIGLDNALDIACNKISALYERSESKDFVDAYFLFHNLFPFEELWENAQKKYTGLDLYGLVLAFFRVKEIEKLPKMIKRLELDQLKQFFLEKAKELSKGFEDH